MNNEIKNKKRASYESPTIHIITFKTENVLAASNVGGSGGFWGEEDSFLTKNRIAVFQDKGIDVFPD